MPTAANRMVALKSSCPIPAIASAISAANPATMQAPSTPSAMPPVIQSPRPRVPLLAASTMLTISEASRTSRKTMMATAIMKAVPPLLRDQLSLRRLLVEVAEELVGAGVEGADDDQDLLARRHHFLAVELGALELLRR